MKTSQLSSNMIKITIEIYGTRFYIGIWNKILPRVRTLLRISAGKYDIVRIMRVHYVDGKVKYIKKFWEVW